VPTKCLGLDAFAIIPRFAVVARYPEAGPSRLVKHIALARSETRAKRGAEIPVWEMGPPLVAGSIGLAKSGPTTCVVHIVGHIDLDAEDVEGIETWLVDVDKEARPYGKYSNLRHYVAHPAVDWRKAENGLPLYRIFSCVGFILECYRSVNIQLIDTSCSTSLPELDLATLEQAFDAGQLDERTRSSIGLKGPGPWRILLPGYVIHSLKRSSEEIRTQPHFPSSSLEQEYPLATTAKGDISSSGSPR
jgi:hypothetical protein